VKRKTVCIGSKIHVRGKEGIAKVTGIHWGNKILGDDSFYLDIDLPVKTENGNSITESYQIWGTEKGHYNRHGDSHLSGLW
jgi:hypothetical protein